MGGVIQRRHLAQVAAGAQRWCPVDDPFVRWVAVGPTTCHAPGVAGTSGAHELALRALRERLDGDGAVTDGFTCLDVRSALTGEPTGDTHDHVVVVLRWRQDPSTYTISFPLPTDGTHHDPSCPPDVDTRSPSPSIEQWADEVVWSLMEELDTGLVRRAARIPVGDVTFLAIDDRAGDARPQGYYIGHEYPGPAVGDGEHLTEVGLDVTVARHLLTEGRLLTWLHGYVDGRRGGPFVGHAVVARPDDDGSAAWSGPARQRTLEVVPGTPPAVTTALAYHAVRDAIEAGADTIISGLDLRAVSDIGFRADAEGSWSVTWRDVRTPDFSRGTTRSPTE